MSTRFAGWFAAAAVAIACPIAYGQESDAKPEQDKQEAKQTASEKEEQKATEKQNQQAAEAEKAANEKKQAEAREAREKRQEARQETREERQEQREKTAAQREEAREENQTNRQTNRQLNQAAREFNQDTRQDARNEGQDARETARQNVQETRESSRELRRDGREDSRDNRQQLRGDVREDRDEARSDGRDSRQRRQSFFRGRNSDDLGLRFDGERKERLTISELDDGSMAARIGFRRGDVIMSVNGQGVQSNDDFNRFLADNSERASTFIIERGGRQYSLQMQPLLNRSFRFDSGARTAPRSFLGVTFDPNYREFAVIREVKSDSPAEKAGLKPGDTLTHVNGQEVRSLHHAIQTLGMMPPNEEFELEYDRPKHETIRISMVERPREEGQAQEQSSEQRQSAESRDRDRSNRNEGQPSEEQQDEQRQDEQRSDAQRGVGQRNNAQD